MRTHARSFVAFVLVSSLFGCTPAAAPASAPTAGCVPTDVGVGHEICLPTERLGLILPAAPAGASVAALDDPSEDGPRPSRVDLREGPIAGCLHVRDQGRCGWCAANTAAGALDALFCAEGCSADLETSVAHLWETGHGSIAPTACTDGWPLASAMAAPVGDLLVSEEVWPFAGTVRATLASRPSDEALGADPRRGALGYTLVSAHYDAARRSIFDQDAEERVKRALASGRVVAAWAAVCGSRWRSSFGPHTIDVDPSCDVTSGARGYHAFLLVGYDDEAGVYYALNSWGESWAERGYFQIRYEFVERGIGGAAYFDQIDDGHGGCEARETTTAAERCAAIDDCAECVRTAGCVQCDDACVEASESGTEARSRLCEQTLYRPEQCTPAASRCSLATSCDTCAALDGCAWCGTTSACLAWPSEHAYCGGDVALDPDQCSAATRACEARSDCGSCLATPGCGWCAAGTESSASTHCVAGDGTRPDFDPCRSGTYDTDPAMCPPAMDAGPAGTDAGVSAQCPGLDCVDCVFAEGCEYCPASGSCVAAGSASCASGTTRNANACFECHAVGLTCEDRFECCGAAGSADVQCVDGTCEDTSMCGDVGDECSETERCCGASACSRMPFGRDACCRLPGSSCAGDEECCGHEVCSEGTCQPQQVGEPCLDTRECYGASYCLESGVCGF